MSVDFWLKLLASTWLAPAVALLAASLGFLAPIASGQIAKQATWAPLSASKIAALADTLRAMPAPSLIQITYDDERGRALAESFDAACRKAGWTKINTLKQDGYGEGIVVGRTPEALGLRNAIALATGLEVKGEFPDSGDQGYRIIAVGPKPRS